MDAHWKVAEDTAVDSFVEKMKLKLDKHREKTCCSFILADNVESLYDAMEFAMQAGDMVSVANYAMMIDWRIHN